MTKERDIMRLNMVEQQIRTWDVLDEKVLDLYHHLFRDEFIASPVHCDLAYSDLSLPIGEGETMLEPKLEAFMLQTLAPKKTEKILHIGTGSGFFTALLSKLASYVVSVEISPTLAAAAKKRLHTAAINNVDIRVGDGACGFADGAPYDAIVLTGSVPLVSAEFISQLNNGGRLLAVVGAAPAMSLRLITKKSADILIERDILETVIPSLKNVPSVERFNFL